MSIEPSEKTVGGSAEKQVSEYAPPSMLKANKSIFRFPAVCRYDAADNPSQPTDRNKVTIQCQDDFFANSR